MANSAKGLSCTNGYDSGKKSSRIPPRLCLVDRPPSLDDFKKLTMGSKAISYPLAQSLVSNVPIYELPEFKSLSSKKALALQDEWYHILLSGPGVFAVKGLYKSLALIDRVNEVYNDIITSEKQSSNKKGDHFAPSGSNSRIWNSFSKHCHRDPTSFLQYYSNPYLPLICSSWLGPHHRLTAQVNIVAPGSAAQISHRDYHIGFQSAESCAQFPRAMQVASQFLTLQGAVAHSGMPVESGPTRLLPFSQMFEEGYMAYRLKEFQDFFLEHYVSVPLEKGDGLFFNPALFHAAGNNSSENIMRSANLLQISSAFGKPMETIDTLPLIEKTWEELKKVNEEGGKEEEVKAFVGNVAEGYSFPTNLDRRVPETAGMAPDSEQDLLWKGLKEKWSVDKILAEVKHMRAESTA